MSLPAPRRDDFEIAIYCALENESEAFLKVLDDKYNKGVGKHEADPNSYTPGRIGNHLVVFIWADAYGKVSTSTVATHLNLSFRHIKHFFIVGVCGGAPKANKDEVLLGDVIISTELKKYDEGKQYPDGFRANGFRRPASEMGQFLRKMKLDEREDLMKESSKYMRKHFDHPDWRYPGWQEDKLYKSEYLHKHRHGKLYCICAKSAKDFCPESEKEHCTQLECGESNLVTRDRIEEIRKQPPNKIKTDPMIHFGPVASGDTVMKSGVDRDSKIAKHGVIGFEMEGAGVPESIPTVVIIKGVCDYADSHKRKNWQAYAAATAAACMKAILKKKDDAMASASTIDIAAYKGQRYLEVAKKGIRSATSSRASSPSGPRKKSDYDGSDFSKSKDEVHGYLAPAPSSDGNNTSQRQHGHPAPPSDTAVVDFAPHVIPTSDTRSTLPAGAAVVSSGTPANPTPDICPVPERPREATSGGVSRDTCCKHQQHLPSVPEMRDEPDDQHDPPPQYSEKADLEAERKILLQKLLALESQQPVVAGHTFEKTESNTTVIDANHAGRKESVGNLTGKVVIDPPQSDKPPITVDVNVTEVLTEVPAPKVNILEKDAEKTGKLLEACQERNLNAVKTLLQNPDILEMAATDPKGRNMLHIVLGTGKVSSDPAKMNTIATIVDLLCENGAKPDAADPAGASPIHYCAKTFNTEATERLLKHGVDVNAPDQSGRTALYFTCVDTNPHIPFVKMLISKGAKLGTNKPSPLPPKAKTGPKTVRGLLRIR